ncbi:transmembrane protein [Mycobacterium lentiflavum]|uniref:Transmembrane protein n=1 Tax=Mycobacterium lentiflavum TaxID=141349 RepID=A0A0E4CMJ7_MYCLN|nr:hypothetical protein [Mycobacterium lentiflavum]CQD09963.1 transmembrane protein [Mycobacterium lentiflavum]
MGVPSLSEIQAWDVAHLEGAARDWSATAEHWESSFSSIHRASVSPGGTVWEGVAAEAAQERAFADLVKVRGLADVLHESAAIARRGADTLDSAKRSVLDAVEEASSAGYLVGEDLSVTPPRASVAAQAQAQVYAADIQQRAAQLVAHDQAIAAKITTASAPLNGVAFAEPPASPVARALGAGFKLDHEWDPYTDQPAHGPFEPVQPGPTPFDPKTGTVQGSGGPVGKGGSGTGGKGGSGGAEPPKGGPTEQSPGPSVADQAKKIGEDVGKNVSKGSRLNTLIDRLNQLHIASQQQAAEAADVAAAAAWGKTAGIVDGPNGSKLVLPVVPSVREAIMVAPDGTLSVFRGDLFQFLPK